MCGRYQLDVTNTAYFRERFEIEGKLPMELTSSWNIAPSQKQAVVLSQSPNRVEMMVWGLIPFWEQTDKPKGLVNLRDDTILTKEWARRYITQQRCIVPATGFYEWAKTKEGKVPYNIRLKNQVMFGFAGVYSAWKNPLTDKEIHSYAIITTSSNTIMSNIHNRMPVILEREDEAKWLSHEMVELDLIKKLLKPFPDNEMEAFRVSTRVNSLMNNDKELVQNNQ